MPNVATFNLPNFKNPVLREDVISVLRMWNFGDTQSFIAENCQMSNKKVSAIMNAYSKSMLPIEWVTYAYEHPMGRS